MKKVLNMLVVLLLIGSASPGFAKDIKMELFSQSGEVLPFYAVDQKGNAITDLSKGDIVLLVNDRNFRDFSLAASPAQPRYRDHRAFAKAPAGSYYELSLPVLPISPMGTYIKLGTGREGVRLHSLESLKIKPRGEESKKELVYISTDAAAFKKPGTGEPSGAQVTAQPAKTTGDKAFQGASFNVPVFKTQLLNDLESYRVNQKDTSINFYCEESGKLLKQGRVGDALKSLHMANPEGEANKNPADHLLVGVMAKLGRLDRLTGRLEKSAVAAAKAGKPGAVQKILEKVDNYIRKGSALKALHNLRELVNTNKAQLDTAMQTLDQLPAALGLVRTSGSGGLWRGELFSREGLTAFARQKLETLRSLQPRIDKGMIIQSGRLDRTLDAVEQVLSRSASQGEAIRRRVTTLMDMAPVEAADLVVTNGAMFPASFREPVFKKMLAGLGVPEKLIATPGFFKVATYSRSLSKNRQGYWEGRFADDMVMVYIPEGEFMMGLPWETGGAEDESPEHAVYLDGYWISKYETTFYQYDAYCDDIGRKRFSAMDRGRKKRPVFGVSWEDAADYCRWFSRRSGLTFRLPTEAEWEKAARGTAAYKYPWGSSDPGGDSANLADIRFLEKYQQLNPPENETQRKQNKQWMAESVDDGYIYTSPVGKFPKGASPYGVMDMAGNVWEWMHDWYDDNYYQRSPNRNPRGNSHGTYRVARGGGWDCHPWLVRTTGRAGCDPARGNDTLGFRVVVSVSD